MKLSSQMQFEPSSSVVIVDAEVRAAHSTITKLAVEKRAPTCQVGARVNRFSKRIIELRLI